MLCVIRLNQNQNNSINAILYHCHFLGIFFFCDIHCFTISVCDDEYQFNDETRERHYILIYYKELENSEIKTT